LASVSLDRVSKVYPGGVEAVKDVALEIADGSFCVLVGPSGCGKSTLLRMVAGLEAITSGTVSIGDRQVNAIGPAERDIAMVFQNYALYPHMNVYDNMAYGLRNRGVARPDIDRRVREAAQVLELDRLLDRRPKALSGGQRQRVAMGRAIVRDPQVFLFDEPLSNLDAKLRGQMRIEIKALQRKLGVTAIYVTHDQLEAMTLADQLVVLNGGRVEQIGAPLDIYDRPASTFVAAFIGAPPMNLLPAAMTTRAPAAAATVGFRPEDASEGMADHGEGFAGEVLAVEPVGAESFVHCRVGDHQVTLRTHGRAATKVGAAVEFSVPPDRLHWFDPDGRRLPDEPAARR